MGRPIGQYDIIDRQTITYLYYYRTAIYEEIWGGEVELYEVEEVRIGYTASCAADIWEKIAEVAGEEQDAIMFTNGSKGEDGRVAGDWAKDTF